MLSILAERAKEETPLKILLLVDGDHAAHMLPHLQLVAPPEPEAPWSVHIVVVLARGHTTSHVAQFERCLPVVHPSDYYHKRQGRGRSRPYLDRFLDMRHESWQAATFKRTASDFVKWRWFCFGDSALSRTLRPKSYPSYDRASPGRLATM
jgi:hypothetical protein